MPFLSIGHSTHAAEYLADFLEERGVTELIDVRSKPQSRFQPGFNRDRWHYLLKERGIVYDWRGADLGGFCTPSVAMSDTLDAIIRNFARRPKAVPVFMCSEGEPCECHRHHWIGKYFTTSSNETLTHIHPTKADILASQVDFDPAFSGADKTGWPVLKPFRVVGPGAPLWVSRPGYETRQDAWAAVERSCKRVPAEVEVTIVE